MKIIVFSYDFPPNTGGISRLTENIAKFLAKDASLSVEVLTVDSTVPRHLPSNIKITTVSANIKGRIIEAYKYLSSIEDKENTFVICGLWWPEGFVAEMVGLKKVYILTHAAEIRPDNTLFRKFFWIPVFAKFVLAKATGVIANSAFTADLSSKLSPKASVFCNPLAVDHNIFVPQLRSDKEDIFNIITITRIHLWKGLDTILEALCSLPVDLRSKIRWKIGGKGPDLEIFKRMVEDSPIANQVELLGFVPDKEIPKLYASADVFALCTRADDKSSNIEGFGLVFLESQSSGTPVIGTPFGGIPSAVENENGGWLVSDVIQLRSLFQRLICNHEEVTIQGINARNRVEKEYTWEKYITRTKTIIGL